MTKTAPAPVDPYRSADVLGLELVRCRMMGSQSMWLPDRRMIVLTKGMSAVVERCALAHQLGHVVLGHETVTPLREWQADRFAACQLIRVESFAYWMGRCGRLEDLAFELGVTSKVVLAFAGMVAPSMIREMVDA